MPGVERRSARAEGVAEGEDWVPPGGCRHAPAMAHGVDAAEHTHGLRRVPDRVPQHQLGAWRTVGMHSWLWTPRDMLTPHTASEAATLGVNPLRVYN